MADVESRTDVSPEERAADPVPDQDGDDPVAKTDAASAADAAERTAADGDAGRAPKTRFALSIVIPAYNEADAIADTVKRCLAVGEVDEVERLEVVVVDDGSADRTGEIAADLGATVVRHPGNGGYGRSLKDGIRAASHDTIAILDADGTYPIEDIPKLLREYAKGLDMVVGARSGKYYRQSIIKMPMRAVLRFLVEFTAGTRIADINSGLRVFSRGAVLPYFKRLGDTFSFTTSLTLAFLMTGKYITHVPIDYGKRIGKSKVRLFRDSLRTLQCIVHAILYYNPIKIFLILCAICAALAAIGFGVGHLLPWTEGHLLGVGGLLSVPFIFALGLLAEQLRQIMLRD